jgi:hypothetical protein
MNKKCADRNWLICKPAAVRVDNVDWIETLQR